MRITLTIPTQTGFSSALECLDAAGQPVPLTWATVDGGIYAGPHETDPVASFVCSVPDPLTGTVEIELPWEKGAAWHKRAALWWIVRITWADAPEYPVILGQGPVQRDEGGE